MNESYLQAETRCLQEAQRHFTPRDDHIILAQRILQAYRKAEAAGEGATALDGKMVDGGSIRLARITYEKARRLGLVPEDSE